LDVGAVGPPGFPCVPNESGVLVDEVGGFLCFLGESFFDAAECACGVAATVWEYPLVDDDDAVLFDFNHPLAGHPVSMEIQVIGVL
jgi:hypothetical protein